MTLTWTWDKPFENIKIFDDEKLVGTIIDFEDKTTSRIYNDNIEIELQGVLKQHIYFVDPTDNIAYCQYNFDNIKSKHRTCEIIDSVLCELDNNGSKTEYNKMVELKVYQDPFGNFKHSGEIIVYNNKNISVDIFSLFFDYKFHKFQVV